MKYVQIQKNSQYALQFMLNQRNESLFLRLQIEKPRINKIYVYQTQIKSNTQVGKMFGGLVGLTEYLEDPTTTKVYTQGGHIEIKIVSKNLVKGKQRQIDLCKINFQGTPGIICLQPRTETLFPQQFEFQKQIKKLQEQKQVILNEDLKRILIKIIRKISLSSKEINAEIQARIDLSEVLNRSIEKQLMIGLEQEAMKDKFRSANQSMEGLWQRMNRQSVGQKQHERQKQLRERRQKERLQQKMQGIKNIHFYRTKLCEQEIEQLGQKIAEEHHQIQKIKKVIKSLQKQLSDANHQIMFKNNLPPIQQGHFQALNLEKQGHMLQFSKTMKNQKIRVINDYSIQGVDDSRGKIAIIGPSIESRKKYLRNNQISVVLKVKNFPANVLFGVCDIEEVMNLRYKIESWTLAKHGGYYINSGSYTYSSYKNEDNSAMRGFKFYDGEPIKITCDTNKKRITFSNKNEQFSMAYRPDVDESKLFFGVVLHKDGSVVEIVQ